MGLENKYSRQPSPNQTGWAGRGQAAPAGRGQDLASSRSYSHAWLLGVSGETCKQELLAQQPGGSNTTRVPCGKRNQQESGQAAI